MCTSLRYHYSADHTQEKGRHEIQETGLPILKKLESGVSERWKTNQFRLEQKDGGLQTKGFPEKVETDRLLNGFWMPMVQNTFIVGDW